MKNGVVNQAVYEVVFLDVYEAVGRVVDQAVYDALYWAVYEIVYQAVGLAVRGAVAQRRTSSHPGLELYLAAVG